MHRHDTIGDMREFFWLRIFPLFLLGAVLQQVGIPVFDWLALGFALILFLTIVLVIKTLVIGFKFGPTILSVADFLGFNLPDEYYDFKPLIRVLGKASDAPMWIEEITEWFNR